MPRFGVVNDIWSLGDRFVLRIPLEPEDEKGIVYEQAVLTAIAHSGVPCPNRVVYDTDRDVIPVAFSVDEMVPGATLGVLPAAELRSPALFREMGREIARLHLNVSRANDPDGVISAWKTDDVRRELEPVIRRDLLDPVEIERILKWLEMLEAQAGPAPEVFTHCDLHAWNIMVRPGREPTLAAFIDWSDACYTDPAVDFSGLPIWALPWMLEGYRSEGAATDEGFEARALMHWLRVSFWEILYLPGTMYARDWWRWPDGGLDIPHDEVQDERIRALLP